MIARLFCSCGLLSLLFGHTAFGEGTYQRTKDGKTLVWNNDPKPGDVATWFGDRDAEGYATKVGTLTWYTADGLLDGRYFGNMVRGKFDGMVNVHFQGKTDHAIFVDGQRRSRWVAGRAPSFRVPPLRTQAGKAATKIAKAPNSDSRRQRSELTSENVREKPVQVASAGDRHRRDEHRMEETTAKGSPSVREAQNERPTPSVQRPTEETPAEGPGTVGGAENAQPAAAVDGLRPGEHTMEDRPSASIQAESAPKPPVSRKKAEADDSLQSLAQPPSSLHAIPEPAALPEAAPRLTKEEVIRIANAEARKRGYNRTDYHRAELQYSAAFKTWSVFYEQSAIDGIEEGKHFRVVVDDKTKGTVFVLGR